MSFTIYKTVQGDTFDIIAKKFYESENRIDFLMKNNIKHLSTTFFESGVEIKIYKLPDNQAINMSLPPWRR